MRAHPAPPRSIPDDQLILEKDLLARVPFHRSTIYRKVLDGTFPAPILIAPSRKAWRLSAVMAWIAEREANPVEARVYFGKPKTGAEAETR